MKRIKYTVLIFLLAVLAVLGGFGVKYNDLVSMKNFSDAIAMDDSFHIYFAEGNGRSVSIGKLNSEGIRQAGSFPAISYYRNEVKYITSSGKQLYYAQEVRDRNDSSLKSIRVMTVEDTDKSVYFPKEVYAYEARDMEKGFNLKSLNVEDGEIYLLYTFDNDKKAAVDKLQKEENRYRAVRTGTVQLYSHLFYTDLDWKNGTLFATTEDGQLYSYENWGAKQVFPLPDVQGVAIFMEAAEDGIHIYSGYDLTVYEMNRRGVQPLAGIHPGILREFDTSGERFCGIQVKHGVRALFTGDGTESRQIHKVGFSYPVFLTGVLPVSGEIFLVELLLVGAVLLGRGLIRSRKRILDKFALTMIPVLLIGLIAGGIAETLLLRHNVTDSLYSTCAVTAEKMLTAISHSGVSLEHVSYNLDWREEGLTQLVSGANSINSMGDTAEISLMTLEGETLYNVMAPQSMCYVDAELIFTPEEVGYFFEAKEEGRPVEYESKEAHLVGVAVPVKNQAGEVTGIINASIPSKTGFRQIADFVIFYILMTAVITATVSLLMMAVSKRYQQPVNELIRSVELVSGGDYSASFAYGGNDEFAMVSKAFSNMVSVVSSQIYRLGKINDSYSRFVPDYLHSVFREESVLSLHPGMSSVKDYVLAFVSVGSRVRDEAQGGEKEEELILRITEAINYCVRATGGMVTSNHCDISHVRILFSGSPAEGVAFAEQLQERLAQDGKGDDLETAVLIAKSPLHFGIAGDEGRAAYYITGKNLNALASCLRGFQESGTNIVVEEEAARLLFHRQDMRFIGFVRGQEPEEKIKLYEVMGTGCLEERILKVNNKKLFEKGLDFFYKGDFYAARNIFAAIVKSCPTDGLAKWYLFAADRFDSNPAEGASFELFGTERR